MATTDTTLKCKKLTITYGICSLLCYLIPCFVFLIIGLVQGTNVQKFALSATAVIGVITVVIGIIFKFRIRCALWLVLIGLYVALNKFLPVLIVMFIATALDEFVFTRLYKKYKEKYTINKEIDARG